MVGCAAVTSRKPAVRNVRAKDTTASVYFESIELTVPALRIGNAG